MMISFFRLRENALPPDRAHPSDAGMDVFYCPDMNNFSQQKGKNIELLEDGSGIIIHPGGNFLFPSGLVMGIPHGYALFVCNRGSIGAKKSLVYGAHVIDSGYEGEIFIDLHNVGTESQTVFVGDKIAQLVLMPVINVIPMEAAHKESLYGMYPICISERKEGSLGSSDKK